MKGISPMIATVLLIAFTIAVGGILSVWLTGYTRTTTEAVGGGTEKQIKCAGARLEIKKVDNQPNWTAIITSYEGGSNLTSARCEVFRGTIMNSTTNTSPSVSFTPGTTFSCNVSTTGGVGSNPDKVRVTGICLEEISVTPAECTPGKTCWTG